MKSFVFVRKKISVKIIYFELILLGGGGDWSENRERIRLNGINWGGWPTWSFKDRVQVGWKDAWCNDGWFSMEKWPTIASDMVGDDNLGNMSPMQYAKFVKECCLVGGQELVCPKEKRRKSEVKFQRRQLPSAQCLYPNHVGCQQGGKI